MVHSQFSLFYRSMLRKTCQFGTAQIELNNLGRNTHNYKRAIHSQGFWLGGVFFFGFHKPTHFSRTESTSVVEHHLWLLTLKFKAHIESLYILGDNLLAWLLLSIFHMSGKLDEDPMILFLLTHYQKPPKKDENGL